MVVVSIDGMAPGPDYVSRLKTATQAELRRGNGEVIRVEVSLAKLESKQWRSYWGLGATFVALGAMVVLRRGDLVEARKFALFAGASSISLAVAPAAITSSPAWSKALQFVGLVTVGATSFDFATALFGTHRKARQFLVVSNAIALIFVIAYCISITLRLPTFSYIRAPAGMYIGLALFASVIVIALGGVKSGNAERRLQALICVAGIAFGTAPFVFFTMLPVTTGYEELIPNEVVVLFVGLIPVSFTVAIMQYGMWQIRTLIHRGLVYSIVAGVLLVAVALTVVSIGPAFQQQPAAVAVVIVAGILAFRPLQVGARYLVDRFIYRDDVDPARILGEVTSQIRTVEEHQEPAQLLMERIADALRLESVALYVGENPQTMKPATAIGEQHARLVENFRFPDRSIVKDATASTLSELRWESNELLLTTLVLSGRFLGCVLWGPKARGDVFVRSEKQLIAAMTPILTLVVEEQALSEERRYLNERLVRSAEDERARVASDLHDGPLQKAIVLSTRDESTIDTSAIARELVHELRETCTRLRPAILDDLGLVSALDWLTSQVSERSDMRAGLELQSVDEDQRFDPEIELALFRVTQEAINNAIKHSGGTKVRTSLRRLDGELILDVSDDGNGIAPTRGERSGLGLAGMRERVRHLNGRLTVRSDSAGTSVTASVPVEQEKGAG